MTRKHLSVLAATVVAFPLIAAAQQAGDVSSYREADDDDLVVQPFNLTVDEIEDMDVKSADGDEVGEVEEVLLDAGARPVAVAIELDDLLGIGDREVVLGLEHLQVADDGFVTSADKIMLEALPDWED